MAKILVGLEVPQIKTAKKKPNILAKNQQTLACVVILYKYIFFNVMNAFKIQSQEFIRISTRGRYFIVIKPSTVEARKYFCHRISMVTERQEKQGFQCDCYSPGEKELIGNVI